MTVYVRSYGKSNSSFKLARSLGVRRIVPVKTKHRNDILCKDFNYSQDDVIINWGSSSTYWGWMNLAINHPRSVYNTVDKRETFRLLSENDISTLDWTVSSEQAQEWLQNGSDLFVREDVRGTQGRGIKVLRNGSNVPHADLYTKAETPKREYRLHIMDGECIDLTAKALRRGAERNDIQSYKNGYVFARKSVKIPDNIREDLISLAVSVIETLGLVFGAVDILRNTNNELKVIEVNSAPGIENTTLNKYVEGFQRLIVRSN